MPHHRLRIRPRKQEKKVNGKDLHCYKIGGLPCYLFTETRGTKKWKPRIGRRKAKLSQLVVPAGMVRVSLAEIKDEKFKEADFSRDPIIMESDDNHAVEGYLLPLIHDVDKKTEFGSAIESVVGRVLDFCKFVVGDDGHGIHGTIRPCARITLDMFGIWSWKTILEGRSASLSGTTDAAEEQESTKLKDTIDALKERFPNDDVLALYPAIIPDESFVWVPVIREKGDIDEENICEYEQGKTMSLKDPIYLDLLGFWLETKSRILIK